VTEREYLVAISGILVEELAEVDMDTRDARTMARLFGDG
jgi:hypothetical protein